MPTRLQTNQDFWDRKGREYPHHAYTDDLPIRPERLKDYGNFIYVPFTPLGYRAWGFLTEELRDRFIKQFKARKTANKKRGSVPAVK